MLEYQVNMHLDSYVSRFIVLEQNILSVLKLYRIFIQLILWKLISHHIVRSLKLLCKEHLLYIAYQVNEKFLLYLNTHLHMLTHTLD